jgi:hypothetical protein
LTTVVDKNFPPYKEPMLVMASAPSPFFQDHSFDRFLFADVGEDRNGMFLSVLSALARLDLDPWFEAASLSRLPAPAATQRLTSLLSSLPSAQLKVPPPAAIMRLVGLLPQATREPPWPPGEAVVVTKSKISWSVVGLIFVAFVMMFAEQYAARRDSAGVGVGSPGATVTEPGAPKARGK